MLKGSPSRDISQEPVLWDINLENYHRGKFSMSTTRGNSKMEDFLQVDTSSDRLFFGIYDGHGGQEAAEQIATHLLKIIFRVLKSNNNKEMSEDILRQAISAMDSQFLRFVEQFPNKVHLRTVGSCCLCGFIWKNTIYVSNLGDSRAVLGYKENKEVRALQLTEDHRCDEDTVRTELIRNHPLDEKILLKARGSWRIKGIMKVSRTIGDWYLKRLPIKDDPFPRPEVPGVFDKPLISSISDVRSREIKKSDKFLIIGSHGFWSIMSNEEAVEIVKSCSKNGIARKLSRTALERAAARQNHTYEEFKKIVEGHDNSRQWHDDISVVVFFFEKKKKMRIWKRKKIEVFCHRSAGRLNTDSEFGDPEFGDLFAAAGSSGVSSAGL